MDQQNDQTPMNTERSSVDQLNDLNLSTVSPPHLWQLRRTRVFQVTKKDFKRLVQQLTCFEPLEPSSQPQDIPEGQRFGPPAFQESFQPTVQVQEDPDVTLYRRSFQSSDSPNDYSTESNGVQVQQPPHSQIPTQAPSQPQVLNEPVPSFTGANQSVPYPNDANQDIPYAHGVDQSMPYPNFFQRSPIDYSTESNEVQVQQPPQSRSPTQAPSQPQVLNQPVPSFTGFNQSMPFPDDFTQPMSFSNVANNLMPYPNGVNQDIPYAHGVNQSMAPYPNGVNQSMSHPNGVNQLLPLSDGVNQLMPYANGVNQSMPYPSGVNMDMPYYHGVDQTMPYSNGVNNQSMMYPNGVDQAMPYSNNLEQVMSSTYPSPLVSGSDQQMHDAYSFEPPSLQYSQPLSPNVPFSSVDNSGVFGPDLPHP